MLKSFTLGLLFTLGLHLCLSASEIGTVAGTGMPQNNGNSGDADKLNIGDPFGVEIGPAGGLFVTEVRNHRVLRVDLDAGTVSTVAGSGEQGYSGDGGPATDARLNEPYEVRFDHSGNMFFVEMKNHLVRRVAAKTNEISTVAGTGEKGFSGDGGLATGAQLNRPHSIALDHRGSLYIADIGNHRIRRVDLNTGKIETFAGNGESKFPQPGKVSAAKPLIGPRALCIKGDSMWIALREGHSIWKLNLDDQEITHIAGTGKKGFSGDEGAPLNAMFHGPKGIAVGPKQNIYVVDTENQAIRMINTHENQITTIAGGGPKAKGFAGENVPATEAKLDRPHGICTDQDGNIFVGDTLNHRVRRIGPL